MSPIIALAVAVGVGAGIYLTLSRDLVRCVVGLAILGGAVNLGVLASGRLGPLGPPLVLEGEERLRAAPDPLPQALVLTAIVISFALLCLSLALAARLRREAGHGDIERLRAAEPRSDDPRKPPVMD